MSCCFAPSNTRLCFFDLFFKICYCFWSTLSLLSIFYTVTISSNILFGYSFFFKYDHRTFLRFHFYRLFNSTTVVFLTFYRFLVSRLVAFFCLLSDFL
uniref:Uncharacterized protein n=1 Tax=Panagrolaimus sp. PS1159 TaxID=55785 RepID=A0AC35FNP8_9BILA